MPFLRKHGLMTPLRTPLINDTTADTLTGLHPDFGLFCQNRENVINPGFIKTVFILDAGQSLHALLIFLARVALLDPSFPNQVTIKSLRTPSYRFFVRLHKLRDKTDIFVIFRKLIVFSEKAVLLRVLPRVCHGFTH